MRTGVKYINFNKLVLIFLLTIISYFPVFSKCYVIDDGTSLADWTQVGGTYDISNGDIRSGATAVSLDS